MTSSHHQGSGERPDDWGEHFFDDPKRVKQMIVVLVVACAAVVALDLVSLVQGWLGLNEWRYASRPWEGFAGFYAIFGFVACTVIVYTAKLLRKGVMRDEDYYDR